MKKLLTVVAVAEAVTGMSLIVVPSLVGWLLLGIELTGVSIPIARVLGIALIALGVGCLPGITALFGMLTYSTLATFYLFYLGIRGEYAGPMLWPAVGLHGFIAIMLGRASLISPKMVGKTANGID